MKTGELAGFQFVDRLHVIRYSVSAIPQDQGYWLEPRNGRGTSARDDLYAARLAEN